MTNSPNITAPCEHDPKHHIRVGYPYPHDWVFRCEICGHENIKDMLPPIPLLESEEQGNSVSDVSGIAKMENVAAIVCLLFMVFLLGVSIGVVSG
jgi:hypothetical protein